MSTARVRGRLVPAQTAEEAAAPLRLVGPDERAAAASKRRRVAPLVLAGAAFVFACLFALAAFQAVLAQNQLRLDKLDKRVGDEQARYERLRLHVAEFESPARIVAAGQERLGMVPPPSVTYLSPSGAVAHDVESRGPKDQPRDTGPNTGAWASMKPYLGGGG